MSGMPAPVLTPLNEQPPLEVGEEGALPLRYLLLVLTREADAQGLDMCLLDECGG